MKKALLFIVIATLLVPAQLNSQEKQKKITVKGTVTDAEKRPVQNAFIMIDGVKTSQVTDAAGQFRVKVAPGAKTIGVVALGLGLKEQEIQGRVLIDFSFSKFAADQPVATEEAKGDEYVNMGYNSTKAKNNTYSVSKHSGNKPTKTYTSIYQMIQEIPGVRIGAEGIIVHESRNLSGAVPALIVVDGVPVSSLDGIPPTAVESIEVLKDASATIYGTRAYGGVVLIKTNGKK
jgi:TonB-dependent SusC/RagA subfamily outer membrane receptor